MNHSVINKHDDIALTDLLMDIRACRLCEPSLPLGANPVLRAESSARILIIGQAPGTRVHASGIPWDDPSGDRLRQWMGVDKSTFYDQSLIAIVPMGFCYPGRGRSGDLPPRTECAPRWHEQVLRYLTQLKLTLFVGSYAQNYYLAGNYKTLTSRVQAWREFLPQRMPLVHPSPRNRLWLKKNPWFESDVVPVLRRRVEQVLSGVAMPGERV